MKKPILFCRIHNSTVHRVRKREATSFLCITLTNVERRSFVIFGTNHPEDIF